MKALVLAAVAMSLVLGCSSGTSGDLETEAAPRERPAVGTGVAESRDDDGQTEAETEELVRWDSSALVVELEEHSSRVLEVTFEVLDSIPEASLGLTGDLELLAGQDVLPLGSLSPGAHTAGLVLSAPLAVEAGAEFDGSVEILTSVGSVSQALPVTVTLVARAAELVANELLSPSAARVYETEVGRVVRDELLVFVEGGPQVAAELAADQGLTLLGSSPVADLYQMLVARADDLGDLRQMAETLEADERVLLATPSAIGQTNDDVRYPESDDQWHPRYWGTATPERTWHLEEIRAPQAWSREVGDTNPVGVAIIDVDFDRRHEDLTFASISDGNVPKAGFDSGRVINGVGHGNWVSGVACAGGDNGVGITGVSWGCDLRAYGVGTQVWDPKKYRWEVVPDLGAVVAAMMDAAADGNRVVNLSLGFWLEKCVDPVTLSGDDRWAWSQLQAAFVLATAEAHDRADGRELLWVASAGNNKCGEPNQLPAALAGHEAYRDVWVSVAATTNSRELSSDSNHAPRVTTLAAPGGSPQPDRVDRLSPNGENILTTGVCDPPDETIPCGRYLAVTGTSFAAPLVTGVAALMFSANPDLTAAQAKTCLVESARDRTVRGGHPFGIIDAEAAVACASSLKGLSLDDLLTLPVPSLCDHPPGQLSDGVLPGIPENDGGVYLEQRVLDAIRAGTSSSGVAFGDVTGDGVDEVAVVVSCNRGGVRWPDNVLIYGPGPTLLAVFDPGDHVRAPTRREGVASIVFDSGAFLISWGSHQGGDIAAVGTLGATARARIVAGSLVVEDIQTFNEVPTVRRALEAAADRDRGTLSAVASDAAATMLLEAARVGEFAQEFDCFGLADLGSIRSGGWADPIAGSTSRVCRVGFSGMDGWVALHLERLGLAEWRVNEARLTPPASRVDGRAEPPPFVSEEDLGRRAIDYFQSTQSLCEQHAARFGNSPPRAERFVDPTFEQSLDGTRAIIVDGLGTKLIVDLGSAPATIYSLEGPLAVLPRDLSFGCPEDIYLGSLDS